MQYPEGIGPLFATRAREVRIRSQGLAPHFCLDFNSRG